MGDATRDTSGAVGWRRVLAVLLVAAAVLVARGWSIAGAQSARFDDEYHLLRGSLFWTGRLAESPLALNDPPFGAAVTALPVRIMTGPLGPLADQQRLHADRVLDGDPVAVDTILRVVAVWRSLLFAPVVALAFAWAGRVYGTTSAWLAAGLLLAEPTFAAHVPLASLDALGAGAILLAAWLAWRHVGRPTARRGLAAGAAVALAMSVKHTALILPGVALLTAAVAWAGPSVVRRDWRGAWDAVRPAKGWGGRVGAIVCGWLIVLWAASGFDLARPVLPPFLEVDPASAWRGVVEARWPAGTYLRSARWALVHGDVGHPGYLFGEVSMHGWRHYFPVLATYKVPIGVAVVGGASLVGLLAGWVRPRRAEVGLAVPLACYAAFLVASPVNIGFRHALPCYAFGLILACRCAATPAVGPRWNAGRRATVGVALAGLLATAAESVAWHPDQLAYVNWPRRHVWRDIADSNLDWGQSLKQVRSFLEENPPPDGTPAYLAYVNSIAPEQVRLAVGPGVAAAERPQAPAAERVAVRRVDVGERGVRQQPRVPLPAPPRPARRDRRRGDAGVRPVGRVGGRGAAGAATVVTRPPAAVARAGVTCSGRDTRHVREGVRPAKPARVGRREPAAPAALPHGRASC